MMKIVNMVLRYLLALMLLVFGSNKFLQFMPFPEMPEAAGNFMGALMATGYVFPIVAVVEILAGLALALNKFKALMLVILFPVMLNALLFHIFLDPATIGGAAFATLVNIYLMWIDREKYSGLLEA